MDNGEPYHWMPSYAGGGDGAVDSVNDKTGMVELSADDVGAIPLPYVIGAVHFDGANSGLLNEALNAADCEFFSFSFWYRIGTTQAGYAICAVDSEGVYGTNISLSFGGGIEVQTADATYANNFPTHTSGSHPLGQWHHAIGTIVSNAAMGSKVAKIYIDNVDVGSIASDAAAAFMAAFNGKSLRIGDDAQGYGAVMDLADFWLAPNQTLLGNDNDIPLATRRKFVTAYNTPVNLGANGELPTGAHPSVFFHRAPGVDPDTFANNLGQGGEFTIVGSLTAATANPPSGALTAEDIGAVSSYARKGVRWVFHTPTTLSSGTVDTTAAPFSGHPVAVGQDILAVGGSVNAANSGIWTITAVDEENNQASVEQRSDSAVGIVFSTGETVWDFYMGTPYVLANIYAGATQMASAAVDGLTVVLSWQETMALPAVPDTENTYTLQVIGGTPTWVLGGVATWSATAGTEGQILKMVSGNPAWVDPT